MSRFGVARYTVDYWAIDGADAALLDEEVARFGMDLIETDFDFGPGRLVSIPRTDSPAQRLSSLMAIANSPNTTSIRLLRLSSTKDPVTGELNNDFRVQQRTRFDTEIFDADGNYECMAIVDRGADRQAVIQRLTTAVQALGGQVGETTRTLIEFSAPGFLGGVEVREMLHQLRAIDGIGSTHLNQQMHGLHFETGADEIGDESLGV